MKKAVYLSSTGLLAFALLGMCYAYFTRNPQIVASMESLGYPLYVLNILGLWKGLAAIALVTPGFERVKEWAYAGLFFLLTGAFYSHLAAGDDLTVAAPSLVFLIIAMVSRAASTARST